MLKDRFLIALILVVLFGAFFRMIDIDNPKMGFYVDEASLAYNSKSIATTGTDEYGQALPIALKSFGDYKSPLLTYISIPLVMGLGEVAGIRMTCAIIGVLTILLLAIDGYLVALKFGNNVKESQFVAIVAATIIAWAPWHINLSRHGIEAITAVFLLALSLGLILSKRYCQAVLILFISIFSYHALKYIAPLLVILTVILAIWNKKFKIGPTWIIAGIAWLTGVWILTQPFVNIRATGVSRKSLGFDFVRDIISSYSSYFSPRMLTMGDWQPRNNIWGLDNLFLWMVISFFIGLAILVRKIYLNQSRDTSIILLIFLLLAPLPASLTIDPFHAIRAVIMIVPISIIAALGVRQIFVILKKKYKVIVGLLFIGLLSIEGIFIYERIVVQNALFSYHQWIGGYDQLVEKTLQLDANSYSKIIVDNTDEPATYSLWQVYGEVDPKLKISSNNYYQPEPWKTPESLILKNGTKVEFRNIYWPKDQKDPNILYIGPAARFDLKAVAEAEATVIDKVTDLEGRDMWMMVKSSTKQRE